MAFTSINDGKLYFNTKLHTGDGGGSGSSTGIGFQPNMVWSKSRTEALNHTMFDSVRGAGSNKELTPNGTSAEGGANSAGFGYISAFNSDGYSWTAGSTNTENFNKSSQTYANWNWKAGTSFTNDASSTGIGTIDSTGSANDTAGFSICSYTGTGSNGTVKHGLNSAPKMIIVKSLGAAESWFVYHADLTSATYTINLDTTGAQFSNASTWNSTAPSSSVFSIGTDAGTNGSSVNFIAYCFAEKQGYSKFGSYTGNGNADGTFCYTGMKPSFVMIKKSSGTGDWEILDNQRLGYNGRNETLGANYTGAEGNYNRIDILSNGFKVRSTSGNVNTSGGTYIYMAFASNPFVTSTGVPATAR